MSTNIQVINQIALVRQSDSKFQCAIPENRRGVMVHRIEDGVDAESVAKFFKTFPKYTGGQMAYTFVILPSGIIEQALFLDEIGWHGREYSSSHWGVALIGDMRRKPATPEQIIALRWLVLSLTLFAGRSHLDVIGHSETARASADPHKDCPGRLLPMNKVRKWLYADACSLGIRRLQEAGIVAQGVTHV